jgi:hypothetical protein
LSSCARMKRGLPKGAPLQQKPPSIESHSRTGISGWRPRRRRHSSDSERPATTSAPLPIAGKAAVGLVTARMAARAESVVTKSVLRPRGAEFASAAAATVASATLVTAPTPLIAVSVATAESLSLYLNYISAWSSFKYDQ